MADLVIILNSNLYAPKGGLRSAEELESPLGCKLLGLFFFFVPVYLR